MRKARDVGSEKPSPDIVSVGRMEDWLGHQRLRSRVNPLIPARPPPRPEPMTRKVVGFNRPLLLAAILETPN